MNIMGVHGMEWIHHVHMHGYIVGISRNLLVHNGSMLHKRHGNIHEYIIRLLHIVRVILVHDFIRGLTIAEYCMLPACLRERKYHRLKHVRLYIYIYSACTAFTNRICPSLSPTIKLCGPPVHVYYNHYLFPLAIFT